MKKAEKQEREKERLQIKETEERQVNSKEAEDKSQPVRNFLAVLYTGEPL